MLKSYRILGVKAAAVCIPTLTPSPSLSARQTIISTFNRQASFKASVFPFTSVSSLSSTLRWPATSTYSAPFSSVRVVQTVLPLAKSYYSISNSTSTRPIKTATTLLPFSVRNRFQASRAQSTRPTSSSSHGSFSKDHFNGSMPLRKGFSFLIALLSLVGTVVLFPVILPMSLAILGIGFAGLITVSTLVFVGGIALNAHQIVKHDTLAGSGWEINPHPSGHGLLSWKGSQSNSSIVNVNGSWDVKVESSESNGWVRYFMTLYDDVSRIVKRENPFPESKVVWLEKDFLLFWRFHVPFKTGEEDTSVTKEETFVKDEPPPPSYAE